MSDFYTRVGEGKYEVHFTTDEQWKYALVEAACREAIDHAKPLMVTENAPRWVRCEEEMPKEKGWYLVYAPTYRGGSSSGKESAGSVMFSKWSGKTWSIEVGYYKRPNCVTHWMPIDTPKEDA